MSNQVLEWIIPLPLNQRRRLDGKIFISWYVLGVVAGLILFLFSINEVELGGAAFSIVFIVIPGVSCFYGGIAAWLLSMVGFKYYPGIIWWILPFVGPFVVVIAIVAFLAGYRGSKEKPKRVSRPEFEQQIPKATLENIFEQYGDIIDNIKRKGGLNREEENVINKLQETYKKARRDRSDLLRSEIRSIFSEQEIDAITRILLLILQKLGVQIIG